MDNIIEILLQLTRGERVTAPPQSLPSPPREIVYKGPFWTQLKDTRAARWKQVFPVSRSRHSSGDRQTGGQGCGGAGGEMVQCLPVHTGGKGEITQQVH